MAEPIAFPESGLTFSLDPERVFRPEEIPDKGYQGVRGCDFVWMRNERCVEIIEVKSSLAQGSEERNQNLADIRSQYLHSLLLWLSAALGRQPSDKVALPSSLSSPSALRATPRFLLVVSGLSAAELASQQDAFQRLLHPVVRAFAMYPPLVLGYDKARQKLPIT